MWRGALGAWAWSGYLCEQVEVTYHYGFPADLGGGPYRRTGLADAPQLRQSGV